MDTVSYEASNVVEGYLREWKKNSPYYRDFAEKVAEKCRKALKSRDILCDVNWRVKEQESLETKLRQRLEIKAHLYKNREAIESDIQDLAGVRIVLYWPRDKNEVHDILNDELEIDKDSERTDISTGKRERQFRWYLAHHYVARKKYQDKLLKNFAKETKVEIQVGSVLRYALAEAEHNIGYKQLSGPLSLEEHNIFDSLAGIVEIGDSFFDQLRDTLDRKKDLDNVPFEDIYQLGSFLSKLVAESPRHYINSIGPLEGLGRLLRFRGLNKPNSLRDIYGQLRLTPLDENEDIMKAYEHTQIPVSVRIMDHIMFPIGSASHQNHIEHLTARDTLAVIISTFVWLDELFCSTFAWQHKLLSPSYNHGHEVRLKDLSWLGTVELKNLLDSDTIGTKEKARLREIARWLSYHTERPIRLAFGISALDRSFLRDLDREWHLFDRAFSTIKDMLYHEHIEHRTK